MDEAPQIDGRYCLIGGDVSASPSPSMMNAAFASLGLDERYFALSLSRDELGERFAGLKRAGIRGLNVTIPFKASIIPLLDGLDQLSSRVGAVNVVRLDDDGRYLGRNTDIAGILGPIRGRFPDMAFDRAVVLGAGGAARAFVEAMSQMRCRSLSAIVRDPSRASGFLAEMIGAYGGMEFELLSFERSQQVKGPVGILFNATPLGAPGNPLPGQIGRLLEPRMVVFDAVYKPVDTELLLAAAGHGCRVIHGYEMLLHQGMLAFEIWTGKKAPSGVMREAVLDHLGGLGS